MRVYCAVLLMSLLTAAPASANRLDLFGGGARGQGLGGGGGALIDDHTALYFNPANLARGTVSAALNLDGAYDRTMILLMPRPNGYDPIGYETRQSTRADLSDARKTGTYLLGLTARPFDEDLTIAFMALGSFDGLGRVSTAFTDEREQYFSNQLQFELLGERMRGELYAVGGSFRLRPWISLGLGVLLLPQINVNTRVLTPNPSDPSDAELNNEVENGMRQALTAGVMLHPTPALRLGVSFQDALFLDLEGANLIELAGAETSLVTQSFAVAQSYSPVRLSVSASYEGRGGWQMALDSTWRGWSAYVDQHQAAVGFEDTVDFRVGWELPLDGGSVFRIGGGFTPSPVPSQTGRTNYVDNDRVVAGIGGQRPLDLWGHAFELGLSVQIQALVAATTRKEWVPGDPPLECAPGVESVCDEVPDSVSDSTLAPGVRSQGLQTGNPGFPGFTHGGYVVSAGLEIRWRY